MQELIEWVNANDLTLKISLYNNQLIEKLKELHEKEKEQIKDAYCEGFKEGSEGNRIMPEEYYYDLYNQFIKKITITEFNQNK